MNPILNSLSISALSTLLAAVITRITDVLTLVEGRIAHTATTSDTGHLKDSVEVAVPRFIATPGHLKDSVDVAVHRFIATPGQLKDSLEVAEPGFVVDAVVEVAEPGLQGRDPGVGREPVVQVLQQLF